MNEYLTHNKSACLVKRYEDPKALADAIRNTCENLEYRRLITAGAEKAAQPFERSIVDAAESSIYKEALNLEPLSLSPVDKFYLSMWKTKHDMTALSKRIFGTLRRHRLGSTRREMN
jgi:hypothetical protein